MPNFNVDTTIGEVIKTFGKYAAEKIFVITGPSVGGIGATVATALAEGKPKQIILAGRTLSKVQSTIDEIVKISPTTAAIFVQLDLTDLSSVRQAASEIERIVPDGIDGLFNNGGIMAPREFKKTVDGVERQFATNHLGHFLLTNLLLPEIIKAHGVVTTATGRSWTMADPDYDNINFDDGKSYHGWVAFSRSKTANIHFSKTLAKRVEKLGVAAFAVDPGTAMDSKLITNSNVDNEWVSEGFRLIEKRGNRKLLGPVINLQQAAATAVLTFLDTRLRAAQGAYLEECQVRDQKLADYVRDEAQSEKLWKLSEELVGEEFSL